MKQDCEVLDTPYKQNQKQIPQKTESPYVLEIFI